MTWEVNGHSDPCIQSPPPSQRGGHHWWDLMQLYEKEGDEKLDKLVYITIKLEESTHIN